MTILNQEVKQPESQTPVQVESNLSQPKSQNNISQQKIENPQPKQTENATADEQEDPNWRAFREARKRDRSDKEAAERKAAEKEAEVAALKAAMESAFSKSAPSPQAYQQYYGMNQGYEQAEESEDQRIERKVNQLLNIKQKDFEKEMMEKEKKEYPNRLSKDFPDIHKVCSQENLDYLDFHYPEVSRPLQRLSEGYDKWSDIYHAVKKFIPNHSTAKKEALRAEMNINKPRSISSGELTQEGQPVKENWSQSEQRRAENWARMQKVMKGIG